MTSLPSGGCAFQRENSWDSLVLERPCRHVVVDPVVNSMNAMSEDAPFSLETFDISLYLT